MQISPKKQYPSPVTHQKMRNYLKNLYKLYVKKKMKKK